MVLQAKNPRRDVPISIIAAMTVCTILYVLMCMAITLAKPYYLIDAHAPFSVLFKTIPGWHWASYIVSVGSVIGVGTVVLVCSLVHLSLSWSCDLNDLPLLNLVFGLKNKNFAGPCINRYLKIGTVNHGFEGLVETARRVEVGRQACNKCSSCDAHHPLLHYSSCERRALLSPKFALLKCSPSCRCPCSPQLERS